jgi:hypothetical protein
MDRGRNQVSALTVIDLTGSGPSWSIDVRGMDLPRQGSSPALVEDAFVALVLQRSMQDRAAAFFLLDADGKQSLLPDQRPYLRIGDGNAYDLRMRRVGRFLTFQIGTTTRVYGP